MFDIGFSELLIVGFIALLVLGPERLPVAIRTVARWLAKFKQSFAKIKQEIADEIDLEELKRTTAIKKDELEQELSEMRAPFVEAEDNISSTKSDAKG